MRIARRFCRSIRRALPFLLVASGCATPPVVDRWRAHDAFERVHFSLVDEGEGPVILSWRAESRGLPDRRGEQALEVKRFECEGMLLEVSGGARDRTPSQRWQALELRGVLDRISEPEAPEEMDPCSIVVRLRKGRRSDDPRFEVLHRGRLLDRIEVEPARRPAWLLLTPFTFAADVALAVPVLIGGLVGGVAAIMLPGIDDFSWSPGEEPNWHRRRSDERRRRESTSE